MDLEARIKEELKGFPNRLKEAFGTDKPADIVRILKKPHTTVTNYLEGRISAPDVLVLISNKAKVSIDWLLTGKGSKHLIESDEALPLFNPSERNAIRKLADKHNRSFAEEVRALAIAQMKVTHDISDQRDKGLTFQYFGGELTDVPLLGEIVANEPLHLFKHKERVEIIKMFEDERKIFGLRARGDSLKSEDIHNGDVIIAAQSKAALEGDRVVVLVDNDKAMVKRYYEENDGQSIQLQSTNSLKTSPIILDVSRVKIYGIVRGIQPRG